MQQATPFCLNCIVATQNDTQSFVWAPTCLYAWLTMLADAPKD